MIDKYKVIVTGGYSEMKISPLVFLFDTIARKWLTKPAMPNLQDPRMSHAACSSDRYSFVFGGVDRSNKFKNSLEMLCLKSLEERTKKKKPRWTSLVLDSL